MFVRGHVRLSNLKRKHNTHNYGWFQLARLLATLLKLLLSPERLGCYGASLDGPSVYQPFSCQSRSIAVFECRVHRPPTFPSMPLLAFCSRAQAEFTSHPTSFRPSLNGSMSPRVYVGEQYSLQSLLPNTRRRLTPPSGMMVIFT